MNKLKLSLAATAVAAGLLAGSAAGAPPKKISFAASYKGTATTQMDGTSGTVTAQGTGTGTLVGASKLSGSGQVQQVQPCALFNGPGTLVGAAGAKISFVVKPGAQGCGSEDDNAVTLHGVATVNGGGGKLAKAKGTLTFTGIYDRGNGAFSVKFTGTLTV